MSTLQPISEVFLYASPENAYDHVRVGNLQRHWRAGVRRSTRQAPGDVYVKGVANEQQTTK